MYAGLWKILPGHWTLKLLLYILILAVISIALFIWVFPIVDPLIPIGTESSIG